MSQRFFTVLFAVIFGVHCSGPPTGDDGGTDGGNVLLSVTSISPDRGPSAGGTSVTVRGSAFVEGATVTFGAVAAPAVSFTSSRILSAVSPPGTEGRVSITVSNPDGRQASLPMAFLYEGSTTGTIADSLMVHPASATDFSGANPLRLRVKGQVKVPGATDTAGAPSGVRAQVAFALEGSTSFAWVDAPWLEDADLFDTFEGVVTPPAASGMDVVTYVLAMRFSVTAGATWVETDRDGSMNGVQDAQRPRVTVSRRPIDWCKLDGETIAAPQVLNVRIGEPGPLIFGQVFAQGVTQNSGAGPGISGQLGVGDAGTPPQDWAWFPATFNRDTNAAANDEFMANLPTSASLAGSKRFAFRFNLNGGPWRYCDADGMTVGGFTEDQTGTLNLLPVVIDECRLQFPLTLQSRQGVSAGTVFGRVLSRGVTEAAGPGAGIEAQLGYGLLPSLPTDLWAWVNASYNLEVAGGQEEWKADLIGPAPGNYSYAFRFRVQGGPWTYCDADPSDGAINPAQLGALAAQSASVKAIAACKLQFVDRASVPSGDVMTAYARVRVPGHSEDAGVTPGLRGEVGVGTAGTNASSSPAWGWGAATFNVDIPDAGEDEFVAQFTPAYTGSRAVSFRFAVEDGGWHYCDLNGSDVGGYEVGQQFGFTVGSPPLDFCRLQFPAVADAGTTVYGQVYVAGVTRDAGAPITAELGWGPKVEDPGVASSWTWASASYNPNCPGCGNNNEYQAVLGAARAGASYAYRFRYGASVCYADLDGAGSIVGGFNGETTGGQENLGAVRP